MELEKLLTPEQLAERWEVKLSWVYRHSAPGCKPVEQRLPTVMVGKKLRFRPSEINAWLARQRDRVNAVPAAPGEPDSRAVAASGSRFLGQTGRNGHGTNGDGKSSGCETEG